jgi:protein-L-isoaspartate(D-aspartate) O-methyltransferase
MLEWLDVGPGDKVLDVGSGSGWTTALIGYMVNPATVYAVEKIPELVSIGRHNCEEGGVRNALFFEAAHAMGLPAYAPFDRILVSASANALPTELITQLKEGGKMVIPVGNTILEITKKTSERVEVIPHHGYAFVPLTP